jgi:O-succinylbenzoate synthase
LASLVGELIGSLPTDVGPSNRYFAEDVSQEVETNSGGELVVPGGPGIGVEIIAERLERFTVATWTSAS